MELGQALPPPPSSLPAIRSTEKAPSTTKLTQSLQETSVSDKSAVHLSRAISLPNRLAPVLQPKEVEPPGEKKMADAPLPGVYSSRADLSDEIAPLEMAEPWLTGHSYIVNILAHRKGDVRDDDQDEDKDNDDKEDADVLASRLPPHLKVRLQSGKLRHASFRNGAAPADAFDPYGMPHRAKCSVDLRNVGRIDLGHGNLRWALDKHETSVDVDPNRCLVFRARTGTTFEHFESAPVSIIQLYTLSVEQRSVWLASYQSFLRQNKRFVVTRASDNMPVRPRSMYAPSNSGPQQRHPKRVCVNDPHLISWTSGSFSTSPARDVELEFEPQDACMPTIWDKTRKLAARNASGRIEAHLVQMLDDGVRGASVKVTGHGRGYDAQSVEHLIDVRDIEHVRFGRGGGCNFPELSLIDDTCALVLSLRKYGDQECKRGESQVILFTDTPEIRMAWLAEFDAKLREKTEKCLVHAVACSPPRPSPLPSSGATVPKPTICVSEDTLACSFLTCILTVVICGFFAYLWISSLATALEQKPMWSSTPESSVLVARLAPNASAHSETLAVHGTDSVGGFSKPLLDKAMRQSHQLSWHRPTEPGPASSTQLEAYTTFVALRGNNVFPSFVVAGTSSSAPKPRGGTFDLSQWMSLQQVQWPQERTNVITNNPAHTLAWLRAWEDKDAARSAMTRALLAAPVRLRVFTLKLHVDEDPQQKLMPEHQSVSYDARQKSVTLRLRHPGYFSAWDAKICSVAHYMHAAWRVLAYHMQGDQVFHTLPLVPVSCEINPEILWSHRDRR